MAADFDAYYRMDRTCMGGYRISELFAETVEPEEKRCLLDRLSSAGPDVRCMFIRHFLAAASEAVSYTHLDVYKRQDQLGEETADSLEVRTWNLMNGFTLTLRQSITYI